MMSHHAERGTSNSSNGNGHGTATAVDHRRSETRILCNRAISLLPLAGEEGRFLSAQLTDCSPHGLGLMLSEPLPAGGQVLIRLNLNKLVLLVYTVRYCIPTKIGQYRTGGRFTGYAASSFGGDLDSIVSALSGTETST